MTSAGPRVPVTEPHVVIGCSNVRVGEAIQHRGLTVFPLLDGSGNPVEYLLSDEAIRSGSVAVEEVSEAGSVPDLVVANQGDVRVLFLEGEELVGAKQNRVLNASVLIAGRSRTKIPVSCVEQNRWSYISRRFRTSGSHSPSRLRYFLKSSVSSSLSSSGGYRSDQRKVWAEVHRQQVALGTHSDSGAMADTFMAYEDRLAEYRENLKYATGARGVAVAVRGKIVAVDLFDKPATCQKVWDRLMSGYVLDALEARADEGQVSTADVERLLRMADALPWQKAEPVGEGEQYRAQQGEEVHASVLALGGMPVHVSVVVAR